MTASDEDIQARIEARFIEGFPAYLAVPSSWLPHLDALDRALAEIEPNYQVAQVKSKFGGLRFYIEHPFQLPCCEEWDSKHPYSEDMDSHTLQQWEEASKKHELSNVHILHQTVQKAKVETLDHLIDQAEAESYSW